ncbi:toxin-antitoxin system YwqK family antitoxin [Hymenobacter sp. AT01-02]|uniref:toxin-antitoxin system YwqK family antitoxin n=1 Tax=Hymenobacter sp. AT01-02 TaxID=1571877 RepID=UPI0006E381E0|nr:hypothetical protein [Hymenobacter sp. AT01-02]
MLQQPVVAAVAALLLASCTSGGLVARRPANRLDPAGHRHGRWREYFDMAETKTANQGKYKHGLPVGRWRYYTPTGELDHVERFHHRPVGLVSMTYYHPNGRRAKQGMARYRAEPDGAHFYWQGEWKRYAENGQQIPSEYYVRGILQRTTPQ